MLMKTETDPRTTMSNFDKHHLYNFFVSHGEMDVRTEKGAFKDKIYAGVFRKTILAAGYSDSDIRLFLRKKWIEKKLIDPDGRGNRTVYIWIAESVEQRTSFKKAIEKIKEFFGGF